MVLIRLLPGEALGFSTKDGGTPVEKPDKRGSNFYLPMEQLTFALSKTVDGGLKHPTSSQHLLLQTTDRQLTTIG